jgi:hypothetical protein
MAAKSMPDPKEPRTQLAEAQTKQPGPRPAPCAAEIDRDAPAGSPGSLGSKSDCNGRPATDSSVVEAIDEAGPLVKPSADSTGE